MLACIIMHNMIIEDKRGLYLEPFTDWRIPEERSQRDFTFKKLKLGIREIQSVDSHFTLCNDLIDHLWMLKRHM